MAEKVQKFTNNSGRAAKKLKAKFKQGVTAQKENGKYGAFNAYDGVTGGSTQKFSDGQVANGADTEIRFTSTANEITLKKYEWKH